MLKYLCNLIFPNESVKLKKEISKKYKQAIEYQRNGNIREYSVLISDIEKLENRLIEIQNG